MDGGAEEAADEEALQGLAVLGLCFLRRSIRELEYEDSGNGKRKTGNMRQDCQTEDGRWRMVNEVGSDLVVAESLRSWRLH